jgi:hypothetical protein
MKNKIIAALITSLMFFSFSKDGCDLDKLYETALGKLKKFQLSEDYKLSQKKKKDAPEMKYYQFTINSGVKYRFFAVDNPELDGRLVINIYNNMNRDFLVASTYDKISKQVREGVEFTSKSTANFCIGIYFTDGNKGCGVAMSSFLPN